MLFLLFLIPPISVLGLSDNYKKTIEKNINMIKSRSTAYVWGGAGSEKDGVLQFDCSGLVTYIFRQSGIPVRRTTSFRMRHGLDGWISKEVDIDDCDHLDLLFWTWRGQEATRPFGHVGMLVEDRRSGILEGFHASGSGMKVVSQQIRGALLRDLKSIRRITIGDKK